MSDPRLRYFYKTWYRVPFLVPAWDQEELRTVWAASLARRANGHPDARTLLAQALETRFGCSHVLLTSTGRGAIEVALRSLGKPGGEVIVPTFACRSIAEAVLAAGCVPVFADVTDDLTLSAASVQANLTEQTIAVLVAHLSGKPATEFAAIVQLCRERGIALIDDAAQAFGVKWEGRYLGSFGEFGIFSFGVGKPTFSVGGGALILRSPEAAARCEALMTRPAVEAPPSWKEIVAAWNFVFQYRYRRTTQPLYLAWRAAKKLVHANGSPPPRGRISRLAASLQLAQVKKLDWILARYTANARTLIHRLAACPDVVFPQASDHCAYTKLLAELRQRDVRALATHLLRHGIEIEWSYRPLHLAERYASWRRLPAPHAEAVWGRLLTLPSHPGLHEAELDRIASAVTTFFHAERLRRW